jgi:hypothetical protein
MSGAPVVAERTLYDTLAKAEERRRLLDLIPPPGPAFEAAARNALRRSGIKAPDQAALGEAPTAMEDREGAPARSRKS